METLGLGRDLYGSEPLEQIRVLKDLRGEKCTTQEILSREKLIHSILKELVVPQSVFDRKIGILNEIISLLFDNMEKDKRKQVINSEEFTKLSQEYCMLKYGD